MTTRPLYQRVSDEVEPIRIEDLLNHSLPRPICLINGCFDLLHASHLRLIITAAQRSKTLICALDSDDLVSLKKGPERPLLSWWERATQLNFLPIDKIVEINSDEDFIHLVHVLAPDFRLRGFDHAGKPSRVAGLHNLYIREGNIHTSDIISRIKERYAEAGTDKSHS